VGGVNVEVIRGADPDVDWGDGGTWNLNDNLARVERLGLDLRFLDFGELVVPPPPPPPARCRVPRVIGLRLAAAKRRIRARHCSTGRVRRARARRALRGRVINQSPRAGAVKRRGFPVKLVVGRR